MSKRDAIENVKNSTLMPVPEPRPSGNGLPPKADYLTPAKRKAEAPTGMTWPRRTDETND